ncbi:complement C3-like [Stegodyphus dumicola]|uniref:complement C3-like n=1 Tax=Stegodyphus dumicola TaxID=202533 RepID=UPI0015AFF4EF|nr:complement C3-like [Stegodyphus dumicola]
MVSLKVTINPEFDDQSPGAAGKIILRGQRDTLVGLLGVDEAVYAISKRDLLTKAKVFNTFNKHDLGCGAGGGLNTDSVLNNAGVVLATDKYSPPLDRSSSCVEKKRQKRDIGSDILSAYTGIERECCALGMNHDTRGRSCEDRTNIVVRYLKGGHKNCSRAFLGCCLEALERGFTEMKVDEQTGRSGRPLVPEIDFIPINEEHIFEKDLFLRTDFKEVWIFQDVTIR